MLKFKDFQSRIKKEKNPEVKKGLSLVWKISQAVKKQGGRSLLVGGFVRDELLTKWKKGTPAKDLDLEVYKVKINDLKKIISKYGKVNLVGESFSVFKLGNLDISLPRRDSKTGRGHKGFDVKYDIDLSFREAARRRDFTINALAYDPLAGEILDEFNGVADLKKDLIKAVDPEFFGDDPLRVLRAAQFAARFNFEIDPETMAICSQLDLTELSWERITDELRKLLLLSQKPSVGFEYLKDLGAIKQLMPELQVLIGLEQFEDWHPEGDVWTHTLMVIDEAAKLIRRRKLDQEKSEIQMWTAVVHDFGKAVTTVKEDSGKIRSKGHCEKGVPIAREFLSRLKLSRKIISHILPLVKEHLFPALVGRDCGEAAVRRLAKRLYPSTIEDLLIFTEADHRGRDLPWDNFPGARALKKKAEELKLKQKAPKTIFLGRHLLAMDFKVKGQEVLFGQIVKSVNEAELDGEVRTLAQAKKYAKNLARERGLKK